MWYYNLCCLDASRRIKIEQWLWILENLSQKKKMDGNEKVKIRAREGGEASKRVQTGKGLIGHGVRASKGGTRGSNNYPQPDTC